MKAFWKSQWFSMGMGIIYFGLSMWQICVGDDLAAMLYICTAIVWCIMSFVSYNGERITTLENKVERLEHKQEELDRR